MFPKFKISEAEYNRRMERLKQLQLARPGDIERIRRLAWLNWGKRDVSYGDVLRKAGVA